MANSKNKVKFGLKNVYYAKATFDEDGNVSYGTPTRIPGAVNFSMDPEGENEPWYADNIVYVVLNNNSGYSGDLEIALIPDSFYTEILHEELDSNGVMAENTEVEVEHFALMFQFEGDKHATRHVLYNCTCSRPAMESATTEDSKEPQTDTLSLTASPLANGYVKAKTCSTTSSDVYDSWFDAVYEPQAAAETTSEDTDTGTDTDTEADG
ncbi:MAG: phage tail protein [Oscillospiraceae bacterium]|nr:phage tail protein [Oscillospiraceae bacterium]